MKRETPFPSTVCEHPVAERNRYFPRQLITADDLTQDQDYFRNKLRRHNRLLHGWGVVCGAEVCPVPKVDGSTGDFEQWKVKVKRGYILGPYGDEILIDCEVEVDLRTTGVTGVSGEPCLQAPDPWCTPVVTQRDPNATLYVAVKYEEIPTRPVRVQPIGCGCNDTQCEYSRWRDGYGIGILTCCPDSHQDPPNIDALFKDSLLPSCPSCPSDPWVVLAKVQLDAGNVSIYNCDCRRVVLSAGGAWRGCTDPEAVNKAAAPAGPAAAATAEAPPASAEKTETARSSQSKK